MRPITASGAHDMHASVQPQSRPLQVPRGPLRQAGCCSRDSDCVDLSNEAHARYKALPDTERAFSRRTDAAFTFHMAFGASQELRLEAGGVYFRETGTLNLDVRFRFSILESDGGRNRYRAFEAHLEFSGWHMKEARVRRVTLEEDIVSLVRRLLDDVLEVARDESRDLAGVVFETRDYMELASLEQGRFLDDLTAVLETLMVSEFLMHRMKGEGPGEPVWLMPRRMSEEAVLTETRASQDWGFRMTFREIQCEENGPEPDSQEKAHGLPRTGVPVNTGADPG